MNLIKYFGLQFMLFTYLLGISLFSQLYLDRNNVFATIVIVIIDLILLFIGLHVHDWLKKRLTPIKILYKFLVSTTAMILATIVIGLVLGEIKIIDS